MRNDDTKERIRRLRDEPCDSTYDVMLAFMGWNHDDGYRDCKSFQNALADLLEDSDPSYWDTDLLEEEYGLIPLPRDKDGECIRVGDTVCDMRGKVGTVSEVRINRDSSRNTISVLHHENNEFEAYFPMGLTHRLPVTVESVLREFAEESSSINMCGEFDVLVAEYATKLRLAEEDE